MCACDGREWREAEKKLFYFERMVDECVIERDRRREKKNASSSACTDLNEAGLFTPNTR